MKIKDLDNKQIVFLYLHNAEVLKGYLEVLDIGGVKQTMQGPMGEAVLIQKLPQESLDELKDSERLNYYKEINEALSPVVNLIETMDPDAYNDAYNAMNPKYSSQDESKGEDM